MENITDLKGAWVGLLNQLHEGAITYGEFMQWIISNVPPPCDDPLKDTAYRCLSAAIATARDVEEMRGER